MAKYDLLSRQREPKLFRSLTLEACSGSGPRAGMNSPDIESMRQIKRAGAEYIVNDTGS